MNKDLSILMRKKIINRVKKILNDKIMTMDDCSQIISYAYQWVESRDLNNSFSAVVFYRNWIKHVKLTRNVIDKTILEFFKGIYKQFSTPESIKSTSDYVAELLSTKKLRNELKQIFEKIHCSFPVLDSLKMWKKFMGCLCNELLHKPLEIKPEKFLDKLQSGSYLLPYKFILINENNHILYEILINKVIVDSNNVNMDSKFSGITVKGNFPLDELGTDFLND